MSYFDIYKTRMNVLGDTKKERDINNERRIINKYFNNSPSVYTVLINEVEKEVNIVSGNTLRNKEYLREIITKPEDSINVGDIIFWDTINWLCIKNRDFYGIYKKGLIQKCNYTLKWLDSQYQLQQSPCIITDKVDTLDEEKYFTLPDNKFRIILPSTPATKQLTIDKRFIFNDSVWITTFVDKMTDGLITLTVQSTESNANDDFENEIADNIQVTYSIEILNNDVNLTVGDTFQLNIKAYANSVEVSNPIVTYISSDETIATVDENGLINCIAEGNCVVTVNYQDVSDSININVQSVVVDNYSINISGNNSISIGSTEIYNVSILNNGVEVEESVTFSLSNELCSIQSQDGNSCTIKAGNNTGTIDLIATLDSDNSVVNSKTISITSLW